MYPTINIKVYPEMPPYLPLAPPLLSPCLWCRSMQSKQTSSTQCAQLWLYRRESPLRFITRSESTWCPVIADHLSLTFANDAAQKCDSKMKKPETVCFELRAVSVKLILFLFWSLFFGWIFELCRRTGLVGFSFDLWAIFLPYERQTKFIEMLHRNV